MDRHSIKYFLLTLICMLCTSCSSFALRCPATCNTSMTDDELTETIQVQYMADTGLADQSLRVYTYERVVTLKGNVQNPSQLCIAVMIARKTCGVRSVISHIKIKSYDNT